MASLKEKSFFFCYCASYWFSVLFRFFNQAQKEGGILKFRICLFPASSSRDFNEFYKNGGPTSTVNHFKRSVIIITASNAVSFKKLVWIVLFDVALFLVANGL